MSVAIKTIPLADRVAALEEEVAQLKAKIAEQPSTRVGKSGWERIYGSFANDPIYEEAMRLGREWREAFRPRPRRPRTSRTKRLNSSAAGKRRRS
jgi:hypothetical protein